MEEVQTAMSSSEPPVIARRGRPRVVLPLVLFLATFLSTWAVGTQAYSIAGGLSFSLALMITLLAHEFGHFLQARRYGVPASFPYFIPLPISPIGTMGAVIVMQPGMGNCRSLFDIGLTGPLAGLVPALFFSVLGLHWSQVDSIPTHPGGLALGSR